MKWLIGLYFLFLNSRIDSNGSSGLMHYIFGWIWWMCTFSPYSYYKSIMHNILHYINAILPLDLLSITTGTGWCKGVFNTALQLECLHDIWNTGCHMDNSRFLKLLRDHFNIDAIIIIVWSSIVTMKHFSWKKQNLSLIILATAMYKIVFYTVLLDYSQILYINDDNI